MRNLVLLATPVDFSQMGAMVAAVRDGRLDTAELLDETGNVPADALYRASTCRRRRRRSRVCHAAREPLEQRVR